MANVVYMMMKFGREIEVTVQNGSRNDGLRILQWLEIGPCPPPAQACSGQDALGRQCTGRRKEIGCGSSFDLEDEGDLS